jgi:hypothetical protein
MIPRHSRSDSRPAGAGVSLGFTVVGEIKSKVVFLRPTDSLSIPERHAVLF